MTGLDERGIANLLHKASSFLSKSLRRKDRYITLSMVLAAALPGLCIAWLVKEHAINYAWGATILIPLLAVYVIVMSTLVNGYYERLESSYESRFGSYPPLLVTLFIFKRNIQFNVHRLLRRRHPLVIQAFRKEGLSLNPDAVITLEGELDSDIFVSKNNFYSYIDENVIARGASGLWATGEFGMLRDPKFIDKLEASKGGHVSLIGYVDGAPSSLDAFLQALDKMAKEEGEPLYRQINLDRRTRVRRLVENKKLSIYLTPVRIEEPHMASLGDWIFIQQRHEHTVDRSPIAMVLVKTPSDSLKRFVEDYLEELRDHLERIENSSEKVAIFK